MKWFERKALDHPAGVPKKEVFGAPGRSLPVRKRKSCPGTSVRWRML
jgi:hypothetical protein